MNVYTNNLKTVISTKGNNILWVDIAKFIGIALMIFQHNIAQVFCTADKIHFHFLSEYISIFHMPLFFILAGYLYKNKSKIENYSKILWSLLIPYICYQFMYLPFVFLTNFVWYHNPPLQTLRRLFLGILFGEAKTSPLDPPLFYSVCDPCWFIMSMIFLRLIFVWVFPANNNNTQYLKVKLLILNLLSFFLLVLLIKLNVNSYFCIGATLLAIPYFTLGLIVRNYWNKITDFINSNKIIFKCLFIIISLVIMYFVLQQNGVALKMPHVLGIRPNISQLISDYFAAILGSFVIILISSIIAYNKDKINNFANTIAKNTLFIIFFHFLILWFEKMFKLKNYVINLSTVQVFCLISISTIVNLIICYYVIRILQKYCPLLLGKYKK